MIFNAWEDRRRLYVLAMMAAKEIRYRAEDFGGEEVFYWTAADAPPREV